MPHLVQFSSNFTRAPSLDTINRTYNNIDLAITQQTDDITRLSSRMHRIKLRDHNSASSTLGTRDKRLPDDHRSSLSSGGSISGLRGPINVTPNVAATTAAALNAERAAQRLKKSLLRARDEPLLNKQAVDAPLAYTDFKTPQKLGSSSSSATHKGSTTATMSFDTPGWKGTFTLGTSTLGSLGSPSPVAGPSEEEDEESTAFEPIDSFGSAQPLMARHRGATKHHTKAVQLKKAPNPTGAGALSTASPSGSGPSGFSWGPLPNIAPKSTLSSDVRLGTGGSGGGLPFPLTGLSSSKPSPASSLSSSWVTDGFSLKK